MVKLYLKSWNVGRTVVKLVNPEELKLEIEREQQVYNIGTISWVNVLEFMQLKEEQRKKKEEQRLLAEENKVSVYYYYIIKGKSQWIPQTI